AEYNINGGSFISMNPTDGAFNSASEGVSISLPAFTATGVYTVCARGKDNAGNVSDPICILVPVYDPNGGFVTGGGTISSPTGADLANPSTSGSASFGFVSKYLPGTNTPSGNLEFQFKAGNLNFK